MSGCDGKDENACIDGLNTDKDTYQFLASAPYSSTRPSQASFERLFSQRENEDVQEQNDLAYNQNSDQETYGSSVSDQPRGTYGASPGELSDFDVRASPEVKSLNPSQGTSGEPVNVYVRSENTLENFTLTLSFASKHTTAHATRLETTGGLFEYMILASAPQYSETGSTTPQVQVQLHMQDSSGQDASTVDVGQFEYRAGQHYSSPHPTSRKRKMSDEEEIGASSRTQSSYPFTSASPVAYPSSLHSVEVDTSSRRFAPLSRSQSFQRQRDPYSVPTQLPSQSLLRPMGSQASAWSPNFTTSSGRSPNFGGETQSLSLSSAESQPMLVRTTTLQQGSPSANPSTGTSTFNPYIYPQKAVLRIQGDLNSMTEGWSTEEWQNKRRLVQFQRSQQKSTINATFDPVTAEQRQPNSICVSCIWWEERQECFVTSVDTIYLLEQLVALRFTVEEKNRIRRNLEGFHPETVSKGKADSEEFFKIIMGFPAPKPRNIEKDVKVFPWKILGHALKKIISKYSASYSSTAGALGTPRTSTVSYHYDSPGYSTLSRSASDGNASAYASSLRSNTMSPHGIPSQYNDAGSPLPSLAASEYNMSNAPSPYTENYFPSSMQSSPYGASAYHHRMNSASAYEGGRPYKRPRANTSNAALYSSHDAASLLSDMSRSVSDHGSSNRLPSLSETYPYSTHEQATPGLTQSRGSYDFGGYLDTSAQNLHQQGDVQSAISG
ncbi:uncharacterized protein KY384_008745 [Bacidia gigantensis]|uniref:uncharacterized protein n=1 Tax=Bacidia gigantensis TaxID=2732470 RepID=UPI001D0375A0|nr:uncharacterized protein KY384_008745 [Bacidia gigantensis]KAG8526544.1 hypothetical protein KY384_008745 [Bacidia gigantensis]